ncbi:MAG TPA: HlyD family secretion protein [Chthoniobacterales bacterium]|nr:HlyD family secretion protein [Chthoniobacterales bacterium]
MFLIAGAILAVVAIVVLLVWLHARHFVSTNDAYTTAHVHEISSRVNGTVTDVLVDDNQLVREGEVIVRLDPRDLQAGLDQSKATTGQTVAQLTQLQTSVGQASAQVASSAANVKQQAAALEKAQFDYQRAEKLFTEKVISRAELDTQRATLLESQGALAAAQAQEKGSLAALAEAKAQIKVGEANVADSQAKERAAALQLSYCEIRAPVTGKISKKTVEKGQRLQPGQALLSVVSPEVWVVANFKENQLGRIAKGQRVDIHIDTLPGKTFIGTVDSVQEGSGATFSLLPPDNATGNFTKIVQRVPVKIVFDRESIRDFNDKIVPGLSCEPRIDLESLHDDRREAKRDRVIEQQNREQEQKPDSAK